MEKPPVRNKKAMNTLKSVMVATALCLATLFAHDTNAQFTPVTARTALSDLIGNDLLVGDKLFSDWSFSSIGAGGAVTPNPADFFVIGGIDTATGDIGLKFEQTWNAASGQSTNINFDFSVSVIPSSSQFIVGVDALLLNPSATGNGVVNFSETVLDAPVPTGTFLAALSASADASFQDLTDSSSFAPVKKIYVYKDISLSGGVAGAAHLSEFYQFYKQIPEPGTIMLLLSGSSLMLLRQRKSA